jgi:hypothetical protein
MDWYCSGMGGVVAIEGDNTEELEAKFISKGLVPEGTVTTEVAEDLLKLGWTSSPWP